MSTTDEQLAKNFAKQDEENNKQSQGASEEVRPMNQNINDKKPVSDEGDDISPESSASSSGQETGGTPENMRSSSQVENTILRQRLAQKEKKLRRIELELEKLRESQATQMPTLPFKDKYDAASKSKNECRRKDSWQDLTKEGMADRRRNSWQDLTKEGNADDIIAEGLNPQDNPAMLTPGRNGPDPLPQPGDETYFSALRQDGSEVQDAAINISQASGEIIQNENDVSEVGSFQEQPSFAGPLLGWREYKSPPRRLGLKKNSQAVHQGEVQEQKRQQNHDVVDPNQVLLQVEQPGEFRERMDSAQAFLPPGVVPEILDEQRGAELKRQIKEKKEKERRLQLQEQQQQHGQAKSGSSCCCWFVCIALALVVLISVGALLVAAWILDFQNFHSKVAGNYRNSLQQDKQGEDFEASDPRNSLQQDEQGIDFEASDPRNSLHQDKQGIDFEASDPRNSLQQDEQGIDFEASDPRNSLQQDKQGIDFEASDPHNSLQQDKQGIDFEASYPNTEPDNPSTITALEDPSYIGNLDQVLDDLYSQITEINFLEPHSWPVDWVIQLFEQKGRIISPCLTFMFERNHKMLYSTAAFEKTNHTCRESQSTQLQQYDDKVIIDLDRGDVRAVSLALDKSLCVKGMRFYNKNQELFQGYGTNIDDIDVTWTDIQTIPDDQRILGYEVITENPCMMQLSFLLSRFDQYKIIDRMTFPQYEQFPTRAQFDRMYAPLGKETVQLNDLRLQYITYSVGVELFPALSGFQVFFDDGATISPIFASHETLERYNETHQRLEIGSEADVGFVQMKVKHHRSYTGLRLLDREQRIIVQEEGLYFGGEWSEMKPIPEGHKLIGARVSIANDGSGLIQYLSFITGPIP